jgi:hypothetical protein
VVFPIIIHHQIPPIINNQTPIFILISHHLPIQTILIVHQPTEKLVGGARIANDLVIRGNDVPIIPMVLIIDKILLLIILHHQQQPIHLSLLLVHHLFITITPNRKTGPEGNE